MNRTSTPSFSKGKDIPKAETLREPAVKERLPLSPAGSNTGVKTAPTNPAGWFVFWQSNRFPTRR
jgi:hypothetical protein